MARLTKSDLELGDIVRDKHGRTAAVTQLEAGDGDHSPAVGPADFGYVSDYESVDTLFEGCNDSLAPVRTLEEIVGTVSVPIIEKQTA